MTYGSGEYARSRKKLVAEATKLRVFDECVAYGPEDLDPGFLTAHGKFMRESPRGDGFWIWKPYLIVRTLRALPGGAILVYADAGCRIYPERRNRLLEYLAAVRDSPYGLLAFEIRPQDYPALPPAYEYVYTKADLAERLGVLDDERVMRSRQVCATLVIVRKCRHSLRIMNEWYAVCSEDYRHIDDSPSVIANLPGFFAHRHDQSVLSLCVKKYGATILPNEILDKASSPVVKARRRDGDLTSVRVSRRVKGSLGSLGRKLRPG